MAFDSSAFHWIGDQRIKIFTLDLFLTETKQILKGRINR